MASRAAALKASGALLTLWPGAASASRSAFPAVFQTETRETRGGSREIVHFLIKAINFIGDLKWRKTHMECVRRKTMQCWGPGAASRSIYPCLHPSSPSSRRRQRICSTSGSFTSSSLPRSRSSSARSFSGAWACGRTARVRSFVQARVCDAQLCAYATDRERPPHARCTAGRCRAWS